MDIYSNVKAEAVKMGVKMGELAVQMGYTRADSFRTACINPKLELTMKIAKFLNVELNTIIENVEPGS